MGIRPLDPYLVCLKMAWHLSREAREGLLQYGLPASMADKLLDFQTAAVNIAARIVYQRGGAIIGDVVGLGKTLIATAIARLLQEEHGMSTLVVCPKNLVPMWKSYLENYEIRGRVESLSMVPRGSLSELRRYQLVVVDESHNLRNRETKTWKKLRSYVEENDSKVVLLSATPFNKDVSDLDAQLSLFLSDDHDLGIRPEQAIAMAGEAAFGLTCEGRTTTIAAFRQSPFPEDWQDLLSQFMVRRTRRFIEDNYAHEDDQGRPYLEFGDGSCFYFPERLAKPVEQDLPRSDPSRQMVSQATLDAVADLTLPRYRIGDYLLESETLTKAERKLIDDLTRSGRGNLMGFTRVMLFKRLSSSGPAFLATLRRHALRNRVALYAVDNRLSIPIGTVDNTLWSGEGDHDTGDLFENGALYADAPGDSPSAEVAYEMLVEAGRRNIRWLRAELLVEEFADDLRDDIEILDRLLSRFGNWDPDRDSKVAQLMRLASIDHPNDKLIVFTEYADTARYIVAELQRRGLDRVAEVTGSSDNPMALARRFSPVSNNVDPDEIKEELRVLVSTDVLSEGQNLQDAHIIVNYDLPWAIVKLVQRAGRVDRIGQQSEQVIVYSLLPAGRIEDEIRLRSRIRDRLQESAQLLGSDEKFFGEPGERAVIEGRYNEESEYELADGLGDVDPVSMAYEIWQGATANDRQLAKRVEELPNVVYSTLALTDSDGPSEGVLVHSQTVTGSDAFAFVSADESGKRVTPQRALRMAECSPETPPAPRLAAHHDLVRAAFEGPLTAPPERPANTLGGVRGRIWTRLDPLRTNSADNLFWTQAELEAALNELHQHPLQETATDRLARALKERSNEDLAGLLVNLHKDGDLCNHPDQTTPDERSEPKVICSMGFTT